MVQKITMEFLDRMQRDADFRASIVQSSEQDISMVVGRTLITSNMQRAKMVIAISRCLAALSRDDVLLAMRERLLKTGEDHLSDGEIVSATRSVDPDLV